MQAERHISEAGEAEGRSSKFLMNCTLENTEVTEGGQEPARNLRADRCSPRRHLTALDQLAKPQNDVLYLNRHSTLFPPAEQRPLGKSGEKIVIAAGLKVVRVRETPWRRQQLLQGRHDARARLHQPRPQNTPQHID